ncbi:MAG: hypothetical protein RL280_1493 [Actinomycetota bacterium]
MTPGCHTYEMQAVIIVLLIVLIGAVFYFGTKAKNPDIASINFDAINASVRGAVTTEMLETAQRALAANNEQAQQNAKQTLEGQAAALDAQAKLLLQPFEKQMESLGTIVKDLKGSYDKEQGEVSTLLGQINTLQESTTSLRNALKSPTARGSWGENQLRTIMKLAGMENYCDYTEQFTGGESSSNKRPDAAINLPSGGKIAVDSKFPFSAYLRMQDATDIATQELELKNHARDIRLHVKALADKKYWEEFGQNTPDFVVMFIPNEGAVADAMKSDINLLAEAMKDRVLIASPVNLLALLLTIAKGWQSHQLEENAQKVAELAKKMYDRVDVVLEQVKKMGTALGTATNSYDTMVASIEARMLVTMREFKELGVVQENEPLRSIEPIGRVPREVKAVEVNQLPPESAGEIEG